MAQQFSDAARSELTAGISAGDTTITLGDGSRFPEANAGTSAVSNANLWFKAVLQDETGFEIVYVRTHAVATTPNTLSNVMRGQEGTSARSFAAASVICVRLTASDMANLWATMATKAAGSVTLTDAAGTSTLPATAAAPIASRLQVLRNNVKKLFADLANKQATLVSGTNIKTVGGQSLLGTGNVPTGEPLPTATTITRTGGVITSMTETVGGTSRVTTITRSGGVVTQIAVAHNGATRTETLTRTNGRVTGITVTET